MRWARRRAATLAVLCTLAGLIVLERLHTFDEPFERDIGSHAVIAHEMLRGRTLYDDLYDSKPPAIFGAYALSELALGYGPRQVFGLGVLAALVGLLGAYACGRRIGAHLQDRTPGGTAGRTAGRATRRVAGSTGYAAASAGGSAGGRSILGAELAGLFAAAFWAAISGDLYLEANQPNGEVFINACLIWAFALLLGASAERRDRWRFPAIGALFALATLFKPVAIAVPALLACVHLGLPPAGAGSRRRLLRGWAIVAGTGAMVWLLTLAYFALTSRAGIFLRILFTYGSYYAGSSHAGAREGGLLHNLLAAFGKRGLTDPALDNLWPLAALAAVGLVVAMIRGPRRVWLLLLGYCLAAQVAVGLPGKFWNHYFQLLIPPLVIAAGWTAELAATAAWRVVRWLPRCLTAAALLTLLALELPLYRLPAEEWSVRKYGPQFIVSRATGQSIAALLEQGEGLFVWGWNPELHFWSKRRPVSGVLWPVDAMAGPLRDTLAHRIVADLERDPPELVVFNLQQMDRPPAHPVIQWIVPRYDMLPVERSALFGLAVHRHGALARRLARSGLPVIQR